MENQIPQKDEIMIKGKNIIRVVKLTEIHAII